MCSISWRKTQKKFNMIKGKKNEILLHRILTLDSVLISEPIIPFRRRTQTVGRRDPRQNREKYTRQIERERQTQLKYVSQQPLLSTPDKITLVEVPKHCPTLIKTEYLYNKAPLCLVCSFRVRESEQKILNHPPKSGLKARRKNRV